MQQRQLNREQYFSEQVYTTEKYVIPYITDIFPITSKLKVAEIGCGDGGNMKPFLDLGCTVVGIDISDWKIEQARKLLEHHPHKANLTLVCKDIYDVHDEPQYKFDLIILRDTLEHIPDQEKFLAHLKSFLNPGGKIFVAFPPWRMPFGGHQQMCQSKFLSVLPYFHLLPNVLYRGVMKLFGESEGTIAEMLEIKITGISIHRYHTILSKQHYWFEKKTPYLISPNYEIKFHLTPVKLPWFINIPVLRDTYVTTYFSVISLKT